MGEEDGRRDDQEAGTGGKRRRQAAIGRNRRKGIATRIASDEILGTNRTPEDMPSRMTVLRNALNDPLFRRNLERALAARAEMLLDEVRQIGEHGIDAWMARNDPKNAGRRPDDGCVHRSVIRTEIWKWLAAEMARG